MQCYKSVCYDIEKASKKVHKKQRLNVLYIISDICRRSQARLGVKDKYGMLTDPPVPPARLAAKSFAKMDQGGAVMCCNAMWSGNSNAAVQGQDSSTSFRQSFRGLRLLQCTMW